MDKNRSGNYMQQLSGDAGFKAFVPKALPPEPRIDIDQEMRELLSKADTSIGRLDGVINTIPNPDLFILM